MPARATGLGWFGRLASALCHGAILATLIAWQGSPQPLAAAAVFAVTLVVEQPSAADSGAAGAGAPLPMPSAAVAEPLPPTPPPAALAPQPPSPPASRAAAKRMPRPATLRSDAAMVAAAAPADRPDRDVASEATAAPGPAAKTATAGAASAAAGPPSADYLAMIMAWLERHKTYPEAARARREQGTVLLGFAIDRGGRVLYFGLRRSSGSAELDAAAEEMIRRADPLPALPASYPGRELALVLPVTFALE